MRILRSLTGAALASTLAIASLPAVAMPLGGLGAAVGGPPAAVQDVQYVFGGRNYCFYPDGWHGPGFYWCGYAFRRGFGWGGGPGWHGWQGAAAVPAASAGVRAVAFTGAGVRVAGVPVAASTAAVTVVAMAAATGVAAMAATARR